MNRGDIVLARIGHPSGGRGKIRPAVVVQADVYAGVVPTLVVAEATSNLSMRGDPANLFVEAATPEGQLAGLSRDSVFSCLLLSTVAAATSRRLGTLSPALRQRLDDCLRAALGLP